jgi:hypothetical protein
MFVATSKQGSNRVMDMTSESRSFERHVHLRVDAEGLRRVVDADASFRTANPNLADNERPDDSIRPLP